MGTYELTVMLEPRLDREQKDKTLAKIKTWIKQGKGKVTDEADWGMRTLAYPIDNYKEAFYYLFTLETGGNLAKILQERSELEKNILRYLLVKKD